MKNRQLSEMLEEMGDMLEFLGDNPFRVRSYKRAAQIIYGLPDDVETLLKTGELARIKGIGEGTIHKIDEFVRTGRIAHYDELKNRIPAGILGLMGTPSLGPSTLRALHENLGITNADELIKACEDKLVRELAGFGPKKEENIMKALVRVRDSVYRFPVGLVYEDVNGLLDLLRKLPDVTDVAAAGSFRRMKETVGDIDIQAASRNGATVIRAFCRSGLVREVAAEGETKASVILGNGIQADLRVVDEDSFGACLQYFTGSKQHNVKLRGIAKERGYKINEYGVFKGDRKIAGAREEDVYRVLGIAWMPPEQREDTGEIELAAAGSLPAVIGYDEIRGDVHLHSNFSDGGESIEAMARACMHMGYEYMVLTDHSRSLKIARGLDIERLYRQWEEIDEVNKRLRGFTVFKGSEVDIKTDGSLDYPDDILRQMDFVVASIHSGFREDEQTMTKRILKAIENPYVSLIGHPTGRILNTRDPYNVNLIEVFKKAAETGTFLEINAYFDRLDLNDINTRIAKEHGVRFCIGTDSHNASQLKNMRFGIGQARRAWLSKDDVINTLAADDFFSTVKKKKTGTRRI